MKLFLLIFSFVVIKKVCQPFETEFNHTSKTLEVRPRYFTARLFINTLLGVWKCSKLRYYVRRCFMNFKAISASFRSIEWTPVKLKLDAIGSKLPKPPQQNKN